MISLKFTLVALVKVNIKVFFNRLSRHLLNLRKSKHCNYKLQKVCNKYGVDGFRFEILEICEPSLCLEREQFYMDTLKPYYNIAKVAGNTLGCKTSLENILKRSKPICKYDLQGKYLGSYINCTVASEKENLCRSAISLCCRNPYKQSKTGNLQWRFKGEDYRKNIGVCIEKTTCKKILCYTITGDFIKEFNSMLEITKELNIPCGNISVHVKNNTSTCYGYIFKLFTKDYPLKIEEKKRIHKFQIGVRVTDLIKNKEVFYESFRKTPEEIIARCTLGIKYKEGIKDFIHKEKFKIVFENY